MMKALDKNLPSKIPNRALVDKDIKTIMSSQGTHIKI